MKNYQNKITINDEEYYVRTEPVIINAGSEPSIHVYTSYTDPLHDIAKVSPVDLKNAFENGVPVYYNMEQNGVSGTFLIVAAKYIYNGEDLESMELISPMGAKVYVVFHEERGESDVPASEAL